MALTTPEEKKAILSQLLALWNSAPHLRLGQLVYNATSSIGRDDCFYIEDAELLQAIKRLVEKGKTQS